MQSTPEHHRVILLLHATSVLSGTFAVAGLASFASLVGHTRTNCLDADDNREEESNVAILIFKSLSFYAHASWMLLRDRALQSAFFRTKRRMVMVPTLLSAVAHTTLAILTIKVKKRRVFSKRPQA